MKAIRIAELAAIALIAGAGVWFLSTRPLDDRLDAMLPQDPALLRSMQLLDSAKLSGKVIVHVEATDPAFPHDRFVAAMDALAAGLASPHISRVVTPSTTMPTPETLREFAVYAPQLLGADAYSNLEHRITTEGADQALRGIRRTLMSPQAVGMAQWLRGDPLGARATALRPLESLGKATGYQVSVRDGHFFSEDLRAAMLILETPVRITDHAASEELVGFIRSRIAALPAGLKGSIICGHLHTLSNQRVIRRDIGWTSTLATICFVALFIIHFRDLRSVLIFIIPTLGILMGIAVVGLTGSRIAAIVVGMGSLLAGIAIDYGIHVYVALSRPETERTNREAVRLIHRTLWLSALTTTAPIAALIFSTIPGYRQLGLLASAALIFSLLLATRALPLFFPGTVRPPPHLREDKTSATPSTLGPRLIVTLYIAAIAAAGVVASGIRVDLDFARLDGTEPAILATEAEFFGRWGGGQATLGIVAVWDKDPEKARQANDAVYAQVRKTPGAAESFFSLASVHPSAETRRENAARWTNFWQANAATLRRNLDELGPRHGFAAQAFAPFFDSLQAGTDPAVFAPSNGLLATLEEQFVRTGDGRHILLSFYKDNPSTASAVSGLHDIPAEYAVVSRTGLKESFSRCIVRDLSRQALIGLALVAILVTAMLRSARSILLVCIPPVTGVIGMLAGLRLAGQPLTPVTIIAGLLLAGNCIDYSVFMLEAWRRNAKDEIGRGVYLAWITTVAGSGLLLVAQHPVLYATGLALTIGLTCGFLSARLVIWSAAGLLRIPTLAEEQGQKKEDTRE